jgi:ATP-dependent DNA helicase RecQ
MQEEIIRSVMAGNDTLALLPTGGGKSLCYQVPALAKEGICLVITPLIALMKDQVERLKGKGIRARAIHSGMHPQEIDLALDHCVHGTIDLLYLSPERLENHVLRQNLARMNIGLLAVDEAHCISQWGYDFRPPYLRIADIRDFLPGVPVLALTATATPRVVKDIQEKLRFPAENVFSTSFERKNLTYVVIREEDKLRRLQKIIGNLGGSGIVYVRSRKRAAELSGQLRSLKISADFYHAGLEMKLRDRKQQDWTRGKFRVMVATNAFGMGIDKPDVRYVVHLDLPDSPEAYFQEAGRAGRDGRQAYATILYEKADLLDIENIFRQSFPEIATIKSVYQALGNYFQLAVGNGENQGFDFDIADFCSHYNFNQVVVFNSLRFLEKQGYLYFTEPLEHVSRILFTAGKENLYRYQVKHPAYDNFIKVLLRSYSGVFTEFTRIYEGEAAKRAGVTKEEAIKMLWHLHRSEILVYVPARTKPQVVFCCERLDAKDLFISPQTYKERKDAHRQRLDALLNYVTGLETCRSLYLLEYFGETGALRCGRCDVCIELNKTGLSDLDFDTALEKIKPLIEAEALTPEEIIGRLNGLNEDKVLKLLQWLLDNEKAAYTPDRRIRWKG